MRSENLDILCRGYNLVLGLPPDDHLPAIESRCLKTDRKYFARTSKAHWQNQLTNHFEVQGVVSLFHTVA